MFESIDLYCERVAPGFGQEPLNSITGLLFVIVGLWALIRAPHLADRVAAGALIAVGLASSAMHSWAISGLLVFDVVANQAYLIALGVVLARRVTGASFKSAVVVAVLTAAYLNFISPSPVAYVLLGRIVEPWVTLSIVLALLALLKRSQQKTAFGLAVASGLLLAGLPFRFLDAAACADWPVGTHFLWHSFNALSAAVLFRILRLPDDENPQSAT